MKIVKGKQNSITAQLSKSQVDTAARNRHVLRSIIEVIILCGRQNIPLRSHDDSNSNFMVLLNDKATRDEILKSHLASNAKVTYTSPEIQNELITLCGEHIGNKIVKQCNDAVCYSFLADEATDASTMEQIAMCVRYYSESENDFREDFVGYIQAESTTGEALFNKFIEGHRNVGLDITKMRGQGYDGASNMSGCHRGVQARVQQLVPQAMYVHCKAHSLNLSIVHACKEVLVRNLLDTVQQIGFAFKYSAKRLLAFQEELGNDPVAREEMNKRTRLQGLCETRWASRADSLYTFN
ncbi:zinc finger MYM-type protein 1-like [Mercenaria mercenaria]|uniref:zinc finger MYM-type protein 1-like n=1 Tax=Mercenaria mercenaria TaxID=6596 RepID=UPI00234F4DF7|nr:zinc finger MYM-type protein 1-like [Mercenaria mercenaria]